MQHVRLLRHTRYICSSHISTLLQDFVALSTCSIHYTSSFSYDSSTNSVAFSTLYLRAAGLHFRLCAFFDSPTSKDYQAHLLYLWQATISFLETSFNIETSMGRLLQYSTNYILQMIIAAAFALLKILNSFFASTIDFEYGKRLFIGAIAAIRQISVKVNDLPSRLAEVLAQLWKNSGAGPRKLQNGNENIDNSLQLKVKCRMSMSLVFDSVWRWREEFQAQGDGNLDCMFPSIFISSLKLLLINSTNSRCQKPHKSRLSCRELRNVGRRP